jgi:hypothetical protein
MDPPYGSLMRGQAARLRRESFILNKHPQRIYRRKPSGNARGVRPHPNAGNPDAQQVQFLT